MIAETGTKIFYSYGGGSSPPGDVDALKRLMSETDRRIRMVLYDYMAARFCDLHV